MLLIVLKKWRWKWNIQKKSSSKKCSTMISSRMILFYQQWVRYFLFFFSLLSLSLSRSASHSRLLSSLHRLMRTCNKKACVCNKMFRLILLRLFSLVNKFITIISMKYEYGCKIVLFGQNVHWINCLFFTVEMKRRSYCLSWLTGSTKSCSKKFHSICYVVVCRQRYAFSVAITVWRRSQVFLIIVGKHLARRRRSRKKLQKCLTQKTLSIWRISRCTNPTNVLASMWINSLKTKSKTKP